MVVVVGQHSSGVGHPSNEPLIVQNGGSLFEHVPSFELRYMAPHVEEILALHLDAHDKELNSVNITFGLHDTVMVILLPPHDNGIV